MNYPDLKKAAALTADLFFPRRCPVCDRPVRPFGALICDGCRERLLPVGRCTCRRCGKPVSESVEYCADCRRMRHLYDSGCAVYRYRSCSGSIYRYKYSGRAEYADFFGKVMADRVREMFAYRHFDMLVPVPVSEARRKERGYNQAQRLAEVMSAQLRIPVRADILVRRADTAPMKNMTALQRQKSLKNAFIVYGNDVKLKSIMLVDDIYTTGSTIDACTRVLRGAGAQHVSFCTLAIGENCVC